MKHEDPPANNGFRHLQSHFVYSPLEVDRIMWLFVDYNKIPIYIIYPIFHLLKGDYMPQRCLGEPQALIASGLCPLSSCPVGNFEVRSLMASYKLPKGPLRSTTLQPRYIECIHHHTHAIMLVCLQVQRYIHMRACLHRHGYVDMCMQPCSCFLQVAVHLFSTLNPLNPINAKP